MLWIIPTVTCVIKDWFVFDGVKVMTQKPSPFEFVNNFFSIWWGWEKSAAEQGFDTIEFQIYCKRRRPALHVERNWKEWTVYSPNKHTWSTRYGLSWSCSSRNGHRNWCDFHLIGASKRETCAISKRNTR